MIIQFLENILSRNQKFKRTGRQERSFINQFLNLKNNQDEFLKK